MNDYGQWLPYAEDLLNMVHPMHGYFVHYPFPGSYVEQPFRQMQIYSAMREEFVKSLGTKINKGLKKSKRF